MEELQFDTIARAELRDLEEKLMDVDPDEVEVYSSDGVLKLELRDGVRVVINSHRAARQIWMAAVASAWHFDYDEAAGSWRDSKTNAELRATLVDVVRGRIGLELPI